MPMCHVFRICSSRKNLKCLKSQTGILLDTGVLVKLYDILVDLYHRLMNTVWPLVALYMLGKIVTAPAHDRRFIPFVQKPI